MGASPSRALSSESRSLETRLRHLEDTVSALERRVEEAADDGPGGTAAARATAKLTPSEAEERLVAHLSVQLDPREGNHVAVEGLQVPCDPYVRVLVGPILGLVTEHTARLVAEFSCAARVACVFVRQLEAAEPAPGPSAPGSQPAEAELHAALADAKRPAEVLDVVWAEVEEGRPVVFPTSALGPGQRVAALFAGVTAADAATRVARFETPSSSSPGPCIAASASLQGPWQELAAQARRGVLRAILLCGGVAPTAHFADVCHAWREAVAVGMSRGGGGSGVVAALDDLGEDQPLDEATEHELQQVFAPLLRQRVREVLSRGPVREAMAACPTFALLSPDALGLDCSVTPPSASRARRGCLAAPVGGRPVPADDAGLAPTLLAGVPGAAEAEGDADELIDSLVGSNSGDEKEEDEPHDTVEHGGGGAAALRDLLATGGAAAEAAKCRELVAREAAEALRAEMRPASHGPDTPWPLVALCREVFASYFEPLWAPMEGAAGKEDLASGLAFAPGVPCPVDAAAEEEGEDGEKEDEEAGVDEEEGEEDAAFLHSAGVDDDALEEGEEAYFGVRLRDTLIVGLDAVGNGYAADGVRLAGNPLLSEEQWRCLSAALSSAYAGPAATVPLRRVVVACAVPVALASSEVLEATGQWAGTGALARSWDMRPEEQRRLLTTLCAWKGADPGAREVVLACGSAPRPACTLLRGEPGREAGGGAGDGVDDTVLRQLLLASGDEHSVWASPPAHTLARCAMRAEHVALTGWERLRTHPAMRLRATGPESTDAAESSPAHAVPRTLLRASRRSLLDAWFADEAPHRLGLSHAGPTGSSATQRPTCFGTTLPSLAWIDARGRKRRAATISAADSPDGPTDAASSTGGDLTVCMAAADCGVGTGFVAAANSPAHVTLGPVLGRMGPSWADLLLETDKEAAIAVAAVPRRPGAFTARVTVYAPPSEPVACRIDGLSPATHYDVFIGGASLAPGLTNPHVPPTAGLACTAAAAAAWPLACFATPPLDPSPPAPSFSHWFDRLQGSGERGGSGAPVAGAGTGVDEAGQGVRVTVLHGLNSDLSAAPVLRGHAIPSREEEEAARGPGARSGEAEKAAAVALPPYHEIASGAESSGGQAQARVVLHLGGLVALADAAVEAKEALAAALRRAGRLAEGGEPERAQRARVEGMRACHDALAAAYRQQWNTEAARRILTGASNLVVGGSLDGVPPQLLAGDANVRAADRSKELEVALAIQAQRVHALYQGQLRDPAAFARQRLLLAECEDAVARGDAGAVAALLGEEGEATDPPIHRLAPGLSVVAVDEGAIALPQWLHLRAEARGEAPRGPSPLATALQGAAAALRTAPAADTVLVAAPSLWFHAPSVPEKGQEQATLLSQWGRRPEEAEAALALGLAAAERGADAAPAGGAGEGGLGVQHWAPGTAVLLRCGAASRPELGSLRTPLARVPVVAVPPWQRPLIEPEEEQASSAHLAGPEAKFSWQPWLVEEGAEGGHTPPLLIIRSTPDAGAGGRTRTRLEGSLLRAARPAEAEQHPSSPLPSHWAAALDRAPWPLQGSAGGGTVPDGAALYGAQSAIEAAESAGGEGAATPAASEVGAALLASLLGKWQEAELHTPQARASAGAAAVAALVPLRRLLERVARAGGADAAGALAVDACCVARLALAAVDVGEAAGMAVDQLMEFHAMPFPVPRERQPAAMALALHLLATRVATPAQRWLCTTPPPSVVAAVLGCHAARDMSSSELARCLCEALVLGTAAEEA